MDREIEWAARAGLDYWAFLTYSEKSSLSVALGQYLSSPKRDQIGFCLILHNTLKLPESQWTRERDRALRLLREPGYQTVLGDRPLVYRSAPIILPTLPRRTGRMMGAGQWLESINWDTINALVSPANR